MTSILNKLNYLHSSYMSSRAWHRFEDFTYVSVTDGLFMADMQVISSWQTQPLCLHLFCLLLRWTPQWSSLWCLQWTAQISKVTASTWGVQCTGQSGEKFKELHRLFQHQAFSTSLWISGFFLHVDRAFSGHVWG